MAAILFAASLPAHTLPFLRQNNADKVCHALVYAILAGCCLFALSPLSKKAPTATCLLVATLCLFYGILEEVYQSFIPSRIMDSKDVLADLLGILIVICSWKVHSTKAALPCATKQE